ncbi:hypothetical protein Vretifemale_15237, partial [Volvox reticuliferus]
MASRQGTAVSECEALRRVWDQRAAALAHTLTHGTRRRERARLPMPMADGADDGNAGNPYSTERIAEKQSYCSFIWVVSGVSSQLEVSKRLPGLCQDVRGPAASFPPSQQKPPLVKPPKTSPSPPILTNNEIKPSHAGAHYLCRCRHERRQGGGLAAGIVILVGG